MRVHIVCHNPAENDRILTRLAMSLAAETGWTLSDAPDKTADVNYFDTYIDLAQRFTDWHKTPVAAYFSHYEAATPYKVYWWDIANLSADVKMITAQQYANGLLGMVVKVNPPIDPMFSIQVRPVNPRPLIGFSGFVDRSGRKGEHLAARLANDFEKAADFLATGENWPVRTVKTPLEHLPEFYNALDLYICTSTVEGVPMPPLEALACGVPVVIPFSVGLLDDISDHGNIYRYRAGDYDSLKRATELALSSWGALVDREGLRETVIHHYTSKKYAQAHKAAFAEYLERKECQKQTNPNQPEKVKARGVRIADPGRDDHGAFGVAYVAYGKPARECATGAIASFKQYMPGVPVGLIGDAPGCGEDIHLPCPDEDIGGRSAKTKIYDLTPIEWQYVLYLDADTEVIAPIGYLHKILLDGWDMVICKNPGDYHVISRMSRPDNQEECKATFAILGGDQFLQLNGGVFAFQRNERTKRFFSAWHNEWLKWGKRDQAALLRALFDNPLRLFVLGNEWNTITRYDPRERSAGILHYPMTARRWRGTLHIRSDDPEVWKEIRENEE